MYEGIRGITRYGHACVLVTSVRRNIRVLVRYVEGRFAHAVGGDASSFIGPSFDVGPLDRLTISTPLTTGLLSQTRSNPLIVVFTPLLSPRYSGHCATRIDIYIKHPIALP